MARKPEHPLHATLSAWGEWMRSGAHDNQGWPGISIQAQSRSEGGDRMPFGPRLPRLNPPPPQQWLRITCAIKQLHRDRITRASAESVMRYYVQQQGGYDCQTARGADMIYASLVVRLD